MTCPVALPRYVLRFAHRKALRKAGEPPVQELGRAAFGQAANQCEPAVFESPFAIDVSSFPTLERPRTLLRILLILWTPGPCRFCDFRAKFYSFSCAFTSFTSIFFDCDGCSHWDVQSANFSS